MNSNSTTNGDDSRRIAVDHLKAALAEGRDWPEALLTAMALWTVPSEVRKNRKYSYFNRWGGV